MKEILPAVLYCSLISSCTYDRCLEEISKGTSLEDYRRVVNSTYRDKLNSAAF